MAALYDEASGPRYLSRSISSMSASRQQSSQIAKAYRQAAQLFLTRRLPEALSTIEPIISAEAEDDDHGPSSHDDDDNDNNNTKLAHPAPVATASRGTRVKVWSFYLTLLNSVVELGADEGKHGFGSARWKQLVSKCRDGSVWDEVVRDGYAGVEGHVDAEVVVNLSTLLLTHSPEQRLNQARLETFLSTTATATDSPRELATRTKLLELYTLHVLPRNDEWHYARDFIAMTDHLDPDRKDAFLTALHSLREEKDDADKREERLRQQQRDQLDARQRQQQPKPASSQPASSQPSQPASSQPSQSASSQPTPPTSSQRREHLQPPRDHLQPHLQPPRTPAKKPATPPPTLHTRLARLLAATAHSARHLTTNPLAFLRTILFLAAIALAFGRRHPRERITRLVRHALDKVRRTVGMGVKVSYI